MIVDVVQDLPRCSELRTSELWFKDQLIGEMPPAATTLPRSWCAVRSILLALAETVAETVKDAALKAQSQWESRWGGESHDHPPG